MLARSHASGHYSLGARGREEEALSRNLHKSPVIKSSTVSRSDGHLSSRARASPHPRRFRVQRVLVFFDITDDAIQMEPFWVTGRSDILIYRLSYFAFDESFDAPIYRDRRKGLYVVARNFILLLLNFSAWPCLAVA